MPKAKCVIAVIYADCPKCGEALSDPNRGSQLLTVIDFNTRTVFTCINCGTQCTIPKRYTKGD